MPEIIVAHSADAPDADGPGAEIPLCASADLAERGAAYLFDILLWRQPARGFALRMRGQPVAYVNRCAHVPAEMDWQPGQFLDQAREAIVCGIHGATYAPLTGQCLGGPCGRGRLLPIAIREREGQVYWYPSTDIRAAPADPPPAQT